MNCKLYPVTPRVVAIAKDKYLKEEHAFPDPNFPTTLTPMYGQDITFGVGRKAPGGHDVGKTEAELKPKMEKLLSIFASRDTTGMARRLFTQFLAKQASVLFFEDADLNAAAARHPNIQSFCDAALAAPNMHCNVNHHQQVGVPKTRIHQALRQANWDITKLVAPTDLGVPAMNLGNKLMSTGDFSTGLGVMINGVQHVFVVATHYYFDTTNNRYCITLKFFFYDVFGLDDDDLKEFGAKSAALSTSGVGMAAANLPAAMVLAPPPVAAVGAVALAVKGVDWYAAPVGITAWWQLQHQHNYAPLVTRIVLEKTYEVNVPFTELLRR
jgi:hypothetical protein